MCGRFHRFASIQEIATQFNAKPRGELLAPPNYNAAPQDWHPVIRLNEDGEREILNMRWGFLSKEAKTEKSVKTPINARAESILTTWPFTEAIRYRRCMVPVNGFYEWKKLEKGVREPYAIGLKTGETFCFAGIWEAWIEKPAAIRMRVDQAAERARQRAESQRPEEQPDTLFPLTPQEQNDESKPDPDADPTPRVLETFAVITCDANEVVAKFHDRMPVFLHPKDYQRWLEPGDPQQPPVDLLRPFPPELMRAWRIKPDVGNVRNDRPDLLDPIE